MNEWSTFVGRVQSEFPAVVFRTSPEFGLTTVDLVNPSRRFWSDPGEAPPTAEIGIDSRRIESYKSPGELLQTLPLNDNWQAMSRRSVARLFAHYLLAEDPQRRLEAREVSTLAHQVSLVRHVLDNNHLRRVLIADEVGLGKTVEAGLIVKELLDSKPNLRILYLAPAKLVNNVRREFERLGLLFRQWSAAGADTHLNDARVIASIHRAVHGENFRRVVDSGPWEVLIVDECHHLSDWADGGGDPRQRFKLVKTLIEKQGADGRVILLSGTPHQGHSSRFENLIGLLRTPDETKQAVSGRVIYRTKEDVRDWFDRPLFPIRDVREPLVIDLGPQYRSWIQGIHEFYAPSSQANEHGEARRRAAGWRCAQALQWAASSPQAGLGYLVRQAIRANWSLSDATLRAAVAALRPYRRGDPDESVEMLFTRIQDEVRQQSVSEDVEDIEDEIGENSVREKAAMRNLLSQGYNLVAELADSKWTVLRDEILTPAGGEKVVLFAQPIETVTALANYLRKYVGVEPALIVGGQSDAERKEQVDRFWRDDGPQFLVSSRAGGEGLNLQVARRLVHIDVPWNPMELEQRVGRVHRFGSRKTILVDTIVVKDSRETHAYRIAREKLRLISGTMVSSDRFDALFARVMSLVPPDELADVLIEDSVGPFNQRDSQRINEMVREGFDAWRDFHSRFSEAQSQLRGQSAGHASWRDLETFVVNYAGGIETEGFRIQRFAIQDQDGIETTDHVNAVQLDETSYFCGDHGGTPVFGPDGKIAKQLGSNLTQVTAALRNCAFPKDGAGAAHLRWPKGRCFPIKSTQETIGVLVLLRQSIRPEPQSGFAEFGIRLICLLVGDDGNVVEVDEQNKGDLLRGLCESTIRAKPEVADDLIRIIRAREYERAMHFRRPSEREMELGIRHAISSIFAGIITF